MTKHAMVHCIDQGNNSDWQHSDGYYYTVSRSLGKATISTLRYERMPDHQKQITPRKSPFLLICNHMLHLLCRTRSLPLKLQQLHLELTLHRAGAKAMWGSGSSSSIQEAHKPQHGLPVAAEGLSHTHKTQGHYMEHFTGRHLSSWPPALSHGSPSAGVPPHPMKWQPPSAAATPFSGVPQHGPVRKGGGRAEQTGKVEICDVRVRSRNLETTSEIKAAQVAKGSAD